MITTKQAAEEYPQVKARTYKDLCARGKIKAEKKGRDWFMQRRDIEAYLKKVGKL